MALAALANTGGAAAASDRPHEKRVPRPLLIHPRVAPPNKPGTAHLHDYDLQTWPCNIPINSPYTCYGKLVSIILKADLRVFREIFFTETCSADASHRQNAQACTDSGVSGRTARKETGPRSVCDKVLTFDGEEGAAPFSLTNKKTASTWAGFDTVLGTSGVLHTADFGPHD